MKRGHIHKTDEDESLISLKQASQIYGYTQHHFGLLCRQGKLKSEKQGKKWLTTIEWIEKYLKDLEIQYKNQNSVYTDKGLSISIPKVGFVFAGLLLLFSFASADIALIKSTFTELGKTYIGLAEAGEDVFDDAVDLTANSAVQVSGKLIEINISARIASKLNKVWQTRPDIHLPKFSIPEIHPVRDLKQKLVFAKKELVFSVSVISNLVISNGITIYKTSYSYLKQKGNKIKLLAYKASQIEVEWPVRVADKISEARSAVEQIFPGIGFVLGGMKDTLSFRLHRDSNKQTGGIAILWESFKDTFFSSKEEDI